jgi:ABC-2 type transport system permease protein
MMITLARRSFRDSWMLLTSCCVLTLGFVCLRVWVASKLKIEAFAALFAGVKMFERLLPVSIDELATPLGRSAFSYEELPVILLLGLWTVARGSDCLAGRLGSGTMEMLLAQPIRRITLVTSHTAVTLAGVAAMGVASFLGLMLGLSISEYEPRPEWTSLLPAAANYLGLGAFYVGFATFASALARTRSTAVAGVISFYVVELAVMIVSRLAPAAAWMRYFTVFTVYEPTKLTIDLANEPAAAWVTFWQYNAWLVGLGAVSWLAATTIFCRRDVPAPL